MLTKLKEENVTEIIIDDQPQESTDMTDQNKNCTVYEEATI